MKNKLHNNKIKIIFLGTNGWYDTNTGNTISILIDTPSEYVVLDAGNGIYKLDQYIKDKNKPIYLFLSHFHLDHIAGLHILAKFKFKQGINICVQKGGKKLINQLIRQPFTLAIKDLKTKVKIIELSQKYLSIAFLEKVLFLHHVSPCIGFRFNFFGKIISYIPDTGLCKNAYELAANADLVIAECAFKAGQNNNSWPHLNPITAAKLARDSKAKKLALVHFDAEIYQNISDRKKSQTIANKIFKHSYAMIDNQIIKV